MKTLTLTTAALSLAAAGAFADSPMTTMDWNDDTALYENQADLIRSRDITGGAIYTMNAASDEGWDSTMEYDAVGADWNQIGTIEDIVLSSDGMMRGIVAEVGGFLDIGDKHVMISVNDLNLVAVDDQSYTYVTRRSEEELESMQGVDEGFWN